MMPGLILFLISALPAGADPHTASFLLEDVGARSMGLGNAVTALADDATALYANPAGLAYADDYSGFFELGNTHSRDFWSAAAVTIPYRRRTTFAVGISGFDLNSEPNRVRFGNDFAYHLDPFTVDEQQGVVDLAIGNLLKPDLAIGAGARFVADRRPHVGTVYEGLYGSFGIRYNSAQTGLIIGAAVKNLGGRLGGIVNSGLEVEDPGLPYTLSAGLAYGMMRSTAHYLNLSLDVVKVENVSPGVRVGVEYWWGNYLAVRAGYDGLADRRLNNPYGGRWTTGFSLNFRGVLFDAAIIPAHGLWTDATLAASARFTFGPGRRP